MTYIDADTISDEQDLAEAVLAAWAEQIPGWQPNDGDPETVVAETVAMLAATLAVIVRDEAKDAFSGFGTRILNTPRGGEEVATAMSRWTIDSNPAGRIIPDGSELVIDTADGTPVAFAVVGDQEIAAAQLVAENIPVVALEPGSLPNGVVGQAREFEALTFVTAVEITTAAAGGAEEESLDTYVTKIARLARRVRALPVVSDDYADAALDEDYVARCLAVNLLAPEDWGSGSGDDDPWAAGPGSLDGTGHVSLFPLTPDGQVLSEPQKASLLATLVPSPDHRLLNVDVHIGEPTITTIDVDINVRAEPEITNDTELEAAVIAAIEAALDPLAFWADPDSPGGWRPVLTSLDRTIYAFDVATVADNVPGVAGVTVCSINSASEITLDGWAPLTQPGTIAVTVE